MKLEKHPMEYMLRKDRMPHIWCPGCGLGTTLTCYIKALEQAKIPPKKVAMVCGIGCAGRAAGYLNIDGFHTTHGRAIPFAIGLKLGRPKLSVTVFSGDGDLFAIGGNHFIHGCRRNVDIKVICINNFNYGMTGGQAGPTTPSMAITTTTPYGNYEHPFNLPYLAAASGAVYVARWTALHAKRLELSIRESLQKKGFTFIEVISPCPTVYGKRNKLGNGLEEMRFYRDHTIIQHGIDPKEAEIKLKKPIVVGKFIDREKPTFFETINEGICKGVKK